MATLPFCPKTSLRCVSKMIATIEHRAHNYQYSLLFVHGSCWSYVRCWCLKWEEKVKYRIQIIILYVVVADSFTFSRKMQLTRCRRRRLCHRWQTLSLVTIIIIIIIAILSLNLDLRLTYRAIVRFIYWHMVASPGCRPKPCEFWTNMYEWKRILDWRERMKTKLYGREHMWVDGKRSVCIVHFAKDSRKKNRCVIIY